MTELRAARRRMLLGALYTASCAGVALLAALGIAPTLAVPALLILLLPAAIVPFGIALNLLFLAPEGSFDSPEWIAAFVGFVTVLAVLQAWMFDTMARNWHAPGAGPVPAPAPSVREAGRTGSS